MRILDITEFYSPLGGGVRTYLEAKARWAAAAGHQHAVAVAGPEASTDRLGASRLYLVGGPPVPASPGYHFLWNPRRMAQIIRCERPDVIEVGSPFLAPPLVRRSLNGADGTPRVVGFFHCDARQVYIEHGLRGLPGPVRAVLGRLLERRLARVYGRFDANVAATPAAAAALQRMGIDRVHLVPLGVDAATFSPSRRDPGWRREVGVRNGQPVALYVGRLATEKRLDVVLEALPQLHQETGLKLVLIGEGHLRAGLERRAAAHPDQLRVLPFERDRERLARAYASADLYLAPFPHETFGLAVVEAMASGLPVVGVASGALEELLGGAPWARLYPPGQTAQLRAGIIELLGIGPRAGPLARIAATRQFSWEETFRRLERVYRNAVSHVA